MTPPRRRYRTDLTDAQWQVLGSLIPNPSPAGGLSSTSAASCSVRCCTGCGRRAARGGCWPTTCRRGSPSTTTSAAGGWRGVGSGSCGYCALASGSARAGGPRRAPQSWTARACGPPKGGAARLRRRQASQRPQAPPVGRHPGAAAGRAREPRQRQRPGWRCRAAGPAGPTPAAAAALWLGGRRLPRGIPGLGAGKVQDRLSGGGAR